MRTMGEETGAVQIRETNRDIRNPGSVLYSYIQDVTPDVETSYESYDDSSPRVLHENMDDAEVRLSITRGLS